MAKLLDTMASELCVENVYPQPDVARAAVAITILQIDELRKKQAAEEATTAIAAAEEDFFGMIVGENSVYDLNGLDINTIQQEEEERRNASQVQRADATPLESKDWLILNDQRTAPQQELDFEEGAEETLKLIHDAEQLIALADSARLITNNTLSRLGHSPVGNLAIVGHQAYRLACMLRGKNNTGYLKELTDFHDSNPIDNYFEYDRTARRQLNEDPLLSKKLDICLRLLKTQSPDEDHLAESIACIFLARIDDFEKHKEEVDKKVEALIRTAGEITMLEAWMATDSDSTSETSDEA